MGFFLDAVPIGYKDRIIRSIKRSYDMEVPENVLAYFSGDEWNSTYLAKVYDVSLGTNSPEIAMFCLRNRGEALSYTELEIYFLMGELISVSAFRFLMEAAITWWDEFGEKVLRVTDVRPKYARSLVNMGFVKDEDDMSIWTLERR